MMLSAFFRVDKCSGRFVKTIGFFLRQLRTALISYVFLVIFLEHSFLLRSILKISILVLFMEA